LVGVHNVKLHASVSTLTIKREGK